MKKKYCIYCSGNASRILKFFDNKTNLEQLSPSGVLYDGNNFEAHKKLDSLFGEKLKYLNTEKLTIEEIKKINATTTRELKHMLDSTGSEYLLCFGNRIIRNDLINTYPKHLINFHPSILPSFKGLFAIDQALNAGVCLLGNTAHYINETIDEGEIIIQSAMLSSDFEEYEDVLELQFPMIKIVLRDLLNYPIDNDSIFFDIKHRKKSFLLPSIIK